jgi:hypothetical protein
MIKATAASATLNSALVRVFFAVIAYVIQPFHFEIDPLWFSSDCVCIGISHMWLCSCAVVSTLRTSPCGCVFHFAAAVRAEATTFPRDFTPARHTCRVMAEALQQAASLVSPVGIYILTSLQTHLDSIASHSTLAATWQR